jgi:hypothetical protein
MSLAEQQRAQREQQNSTTPFYRIPTELRLQYYEEVIAGNISVQVPTDLHPHTTKSPAFLRTCRLLRHEIEPLYYSIPTLSVSFTPQVNGKPSFPGGVITVKRWSDRILSMRDISCDKLGVNIGFYESSQFDWTQRPFRPKITLHFDPTGGVSKHRVVTPHGDGKFDGYEQVKVLLEEFNARLGSDGYCLKEEDVRRLFSILLFGQLKITP